MIDILKDMEKTVENDPDLYWDGWTVVKWKPMNFANIYMNPKARRRNGQWGIEQYRVVPTKSGWVRI